MIDKSGAKKGLIISLLKKKKIANVGDIVIIVIKKALKKKFTLKKLAQKGKIYRSLIVKKKINKNKISNLNIKFKKKGVILLKREENEPQSIRLFGPVSIEIRQKGFAKILSMANFII